MAGDAPGLFKCLATFFRKSPPILLKPMNWSKAESLKQSKFSKLGAKLSLFSLLLLIAMVGQCVTSIVEDSSLSRGPEGGAEPGAIASLAQQQQGRKSKDRKAGDAGSRASVR